MPQFDAGSIVGTADLDLEPFHRKLDEAEERVQRFEDREWTARLGLDDSSALRHYADMQDRLDRYAERDATATLRLDTAPALRDLVRMNAELDALTRDRTINVNESTSGGGGGFGGGGGIGRWGAIAGGAALFGGPVGAVAGGGLLGVAGAGAVAGLGGGAFLGGALPTIKAVTTAQDQLTKAQQAYTLAQLEGSKSGMHDALAKQKEILDALTVSERAALGPLGQLHTAWKAYQAALAPQALSLFTAALHTATDLLPAVTPLATAAGTALGGLFREADKAVRSSEFRTVLDQLTTQVGPDLTALGHIVGNLATTFAHASAAAGPLVHDVLDGLVRGTAALDRGVQSSGFLHFLDYAQREGPVVGHALEAVGGALLAIVKGLAPVGDLLLRVTPGIAQLVTAAAPLAPEILGVWAAAKGFGVLHDVGKAVEVLDLTLKGTLIGALVGLAAEFAIAYETSQHFRDEVNGAVRDVEQVAGAALHGVVTNAIKPLSDAWLTAVGVIVHGADSAFSWVPGVGGKLDSAASAFDSFRGSVDSTLTGLANDAASLGDQAGAAFSQSFLSQLDNAFKIGRAAAQAVSSAELKAEQSDVENQRGSLLKLLGTQSGSAAQATLKQIGVINEQLGGLTSTAKGTLAINDPLAGIVTTYQKAHPVISNPHPGPAGAGLTPFGPDPGVGGGGGSSAGANAALVDYSNQISNGLATAVKRGVPAVQQETIRLRDTILKEFKNPAAAQQRQQALALLAQEAPKALQAARKNAEDAARVLGTTITADIVKAVQGGAPAVLHEIDTLRTKVINTLKAPDQAAERHSLLGYLSSQLIGLQQDATRLHALTTQLNTDKTSLTQLQSDAASYRSSAYSSLSGGASLTDALSSGQGITSYLGNQLTVLQTFAGELKQLKAAGIGNAALEMVVAAGPVAGGAIAKALLTSGTTGQASSLVDQIQGLAGTVATDEEQTIYSPQLDTLHDDMTVLSGQIHDLQTIVAKTASITGDRVAQGLNGVARSAMHKGSASAVPRRQHKLR